jgi:chromosome segregation ATPase
LEHLLASAAPRERDAVNAKIQYPGSAREDQMQDFLDQLGRKLDTYVQQMQAMAAAHQLLIEQWGQKLEHYFGQGDARRQLGRELVEQRAQNLDLLRNIYRIEEQLSHVESQERTRNLDLQNEIDRERAQNLDLKNQIDRERARNLDLQNQIDRQPDLQNQIDRERAQNLDLLRQIGRLEEQLGHVGSGLESSLREAQEALQGLRRSRVLRAISWMAPRPYATTVRVQQALEHAVSALEGIQIGS